MKVFFNRERSNVLITVPCGFWQALGLRRDDTFSVTMLGHCIEMYIGDSEAYIGKMTSLKCTLGILKLILERLNHPPSNGFSVVSLETSSNVRDSRNLFVRIVQYKLVTHFKLSTYCL